MCKVKALILLKLHQITLNRTKCICKERADLPQIASNRTKRYHIEVKIIESYQTPNCTNLNQAACNNLTYTGCQSSCGHHAVTTMCAVLCSNLREASKFGSPLTCR